MQKDWSIYKNQEFNKLTVKDWVTRKGRTYFICQCSCEKKTIKEIRVDKILTNETKSCGCYNKSADSKHNNNTGNPLRSLFNEYFRNAHRRGYEFKLTEQQFENLIYQNCYYCDTPPSNGNSKNIKIIYSGIDRLDNSKGYIPGNVVACCKVCNFIKGTLDKDFFIEHLSKNCFESGLTVSTIKGYIVHIETKGVFNGLLPRRLQ